MRRIIKRIFKRWQKHPTPQSAVKVDDDFELPKYNAIYRKNGW